MLADLMELDLRRMRKMARTIDYKTLIDAVERYVHSEKLSESGSNLCDTRIDQDEQKSGDTNV